MKHSAVSAWFFAFVCCASGEQNESSASTNTPPPSPPAPQTAPAPSSATQPETSRKPSPAPSPSSPAPDKAAAEHARIASVNALFAAVFRNDAGRVQEILAAGTSPNDALPVPVDPAVADLFRPTVLSYFLSGERGLTPLMVAATMGHREIAEILLRSGANTNARTKRHGTNALWLAGYMGHNAVTQLLLGVEPGSAADRMRIEVDLDAQTAQLFVGDVAEAAVPISSGNKGHPTPKGEFVVTDKHRQWRSTLYHVSMPFYLRLSCRAFGLHAGYLPGHPASHGCIRLNKKDAQDFFERVPVGTLVIIK